MIYSHKTIVHLANTLSESAFTSIYNKQKKAIEIAEIEPIKCVLFGH